jgi:micrococcal nuclease
LIVALAACLGGAGGEFAPGGSGLGSPADSGVRATVTDVVDGDTVEVRFSNGSRDTVRLLGVDTPEVYVPNEPEEFEGVPNTAAGAACLEDAGERASAYAEARLADRTVRVVFDETAERRGYYGRLLAYVRVDGESFNYALVATGRARVYESTFTERERYEAAEERAREARRGLWSCATLAPARNSSESPLAVVTVHPDAAGREYENLNDEYVVFRNAGERTLNLSGWTVVDAAGATYAVPAGTALAPGEELTLRTGSGVDDEHALYWGRDRPVWNNDGDVVTVRDGDGDPVLERRY